MYTHSICSVCSLQSALALLHHWWPTHLAAVESMSCCIAARYKAKAQQQEQQQQQQTCQESAWNQDREPSIGSQLVQGLMTSESKQSTSMAASGENFQASSSKLGKTCEDCALQAKALQEVLQEGSADWKSLPSLCFRRFCRKGCKPHNRPEDSLICAFRRALWVSFGAGGPRRGGGGGILGEGA